MFSGQQFWSLGLFLEPCNNLSNTPLTPFPRNCLEISEGGLYHNIILCVIHIYCPRHYTVSVLKVKVCAWISQHSWISQPSALSLLICFETGDCQHHMPFPYFASSNNCLLLLLSSIFSLPFSLLSNSSSDFLIIGGGGAWASPEFCPTLSFGGHWPLVSPQTTLGPLTPPHLAFSGITE